MKKNILYLAFTAMIIFSILSFGICAPSFRGYTGLMYVPNADALGLGSWNVGAFYNDSDSDDTLNHFVANYGVAEGVEVGIDRFKFDNNSSTETLLNGKYAIRPESDLQPGMAAGIIDATNEIDTTVYFVVSKSFTNKLGEYDGDIITPRVHLGIGGGGLDGLFGGVSVFLGNTLQLTGEYDSRNINLGGRLHITRNIGIHAGFFDVGGDSRFGAGMSFAMHY